MRRAFTLIELLVAVTVIALLVAILLPSLAVARDQARGTVCLSNLRMLALAAHNYAGSFDNRFPISRDDKAEWDFAVTTDSFGNNVLSPGILWQGATNLKIQQCPSYTGRSATLTDPFTGYNYNTSFLGKGVGETVIQPARIDQVGHPINTALFGDGLYYGNVTNKYMRSPLPYPISPDGLSLFSRAAGTQGYRHRGKTNVAFVDGHAEPWAERSTAGIPIVTPGTGFLSADNSLYDPQ